MFSTRHPVVASAFLSFAIFLPVIAAMRGESAKAETAAMKSAAVVSLDGPSWLLAVDPKNVGRERKWWEKPAPEAKVAKTPGIIQETFPAYHGVAWYWRDFTPPANTLEQGRCLLRFWQVDYLADVWVNGVHVGRHEGAGEPFVLDVTEAVKPQAVNRIAVRVLNPTNEPIDGIKLPETPHSLKSIPWTPGRSANWGGITDSVELLVTPAVRVEDLFVRPDPKTGQIRVQVNLRNAGKQAVQGRIALSVSPAVGGETLIAAQLDRQLPPGDTLIETKLEVERPRLWELNDPYMYRVTVRASVDSTGSFDEQSARCGFRDFRFQDGYFRLNGKRIFLKSSHTASDAPVGIIVSPDPDLLRKDLLNCKVIGLNMIRFFNGLAPRYQLELCDEIGLLAYQENYAGWFVEPSPKLAERFNRTTRAMVKRDRNHPCVVMWGLLNETPAGPVFEHAVAALPLVRALDDTRVVLLNSGRYDGVLVRLSAVTPVGSIVGWPKGLRAEPWAAVNVTRQTIRAWGITWPPRHAALHPGPKNEFSAVRWTAPAAGKAEVEAKFVGFSSQRATTDVHVLHNGRSLFDGLLNLSGASNEAAFSKRLAVAAGDTIDCAVGPGNGDHRGDVTGLVFRVKSAGKTHDAAAEFSTAANPNGAWSYGQMSAAAPDAATPDAATFASYPVARVSGAVGSLSNPSSTAWEDVIGDRHVYPNLPHTGDIIHWLRTFDANGQPVFLSEYGIGSAVDLTRLARHYEQWGNTSCEDAVIYRRFLDRFMADWQRWNMGDTFANPEDYFRQCLAWMAGLRKLGTNAIRANPNVIGYSVTGTQDQVLTGEGLTATTFRELKPGAVDAMFDAFYPLRWCLFVEPVQVYRGRKARLEAVLANEDVLAPGEYPVRLQVVGPRNVNVFDRIITVNIPDPKGKSEPKFSLPVFAEDVVIDGPSGKYRFLAAFQQGGAAAGGDVQFYVADPAEMPAVKTKVVLWGEDADLGKWLKAHGIKTRAFAPGAQSSREVILVGNRPAAGEAEAFRELARHIARGSHAVFLSPKVFHQDDTHPGGVNRTRWLPLANKGRRIDLPAWLYHKDDWAKNHPIFEGLPAGCILDHAFYQDVIGNSGWSGQDVPAEVVAGSINTSCGYDSGLLVAVYELGAGRFTLNTLRIREHLGSDPVAERLLRNMLRYAARDVSKPPADLPADFEAQLKAMGH